MKNVNPAAVVTATSSGVFRWSASAPVGPSQPACTMPASASVITSTGVRPVRCISRIDCCGKIGWIGTPAARRACTWPGVARPIRSPKPKLGSSPSVTAVSVPPSS